MDTAAHDVIVAAAKENMVRVLTGTSASVNTVADTVSAVVGELARDARKTGISLRKSLHEVIGAAMRGVTEKGMDRETAVQALVMGTLKGMKARGREAYSAVGVVARSIIVNTAPATGEVKAVTRSLLKGVIHSAGQSGVNATKAVAAAARVAVKTGHALNAEIGDMISRAATGRIAGVKVMVQEDYHKRRKRRTV